MAITFIDHLRLAMRVSLGVESGAAAELHPRRLEQVAPHVAGEDKVSINDDRAWEAM